MNQGDDEQHHQVKVIENGVKDDATRFIPSMENATLLSEGQDSDNGSDGILVNLPTSKDISDKLVSNKMERLNIENHELKTENADLRNEFSHLKKLYAELKSKYDRTNASVESSKKELQSMVIKYATSEKEVITLKKHYAETDRKCKEAFKEREILQSKIKDLSAEKKQMLSNVERHILEAATLRNENEILKNKLEQADVREQQLQLKLTESNTLQQQASEKLERIENGLQQLSQMNHGVSTTGEEQKSQMVNESVDGGQPVDSGSTEEEEEKKASIGLEQKQNNDVTNWVDQYLRCLEQNRLLSAELELANDDRSQLEEKVAQLQQKVTAVQSQTRDYRQKLELIESLKNELIAKQNAIDSLKEKFDQINSINRELVSEVESSKHKEGELLEYTERLTAKMVSLQSEHNILCEKLRIAEEQCEAHKKDHAAVIAAKTQIETQLESYRTENEAQQVQLKQQLTESEAFIAEQQRKIEELENDIKIIKRKHIASLKELNKEIQTLKRQRDSSDQAKASKLSQVPTENSNSSTLSSRTNSFTSLSEMNVTCDNANQNLCSSQVRYDGGISGGNSQQHGSPATRTQAPGHSPSAASLSDGSTASSSGNDLITSLNDIDKSVLIERILRLQKNLLKRNEKIDFLEEHNEQLTEEVRKKSKLLQYYILKEETGALATETMDQNKAYLSKRGGGIMASLYNSFSTDDSVTLERSLEINSKLHTVLEDTLLKNMTLKENLNTLASEIDRLTKVSNNK